MKKYIFLFVMAQIFIVAQSKAAMVAVGSAHSCSILDDGVKCWGSNWSGQLGNNSTIDSLIPVKVEGLTDNVTAIESKTHHTCVIVDHHVKCWGSNWSGQLGINSTLDSLTPVQVMGLTGEVTAISVGYAHTCAIIDGGVKCWGSNLSGQLGNNTTVDSFIPVQVEGLTQDVTAIAAGYRHTCAVLHGGIKCWGDNEVGQLGDGSTVSSHIPAQVQGLTQGVSMIATGSYHTCAIVDQGLKCWGDNWTGQLGNSSVTKSLIPVEVEGLTQGLTALGLGEGHSCAIVNDEVKCWGANRLGQLGNSSFSGRSSSPVKVDGLGREVVGLAVGSAHSCVILNNYLKCWGSNHRGQLGNNTQENRSNPSLVFQSSVESARRRASSDPQIVAWQALRDLDEARTMRTLTAKTALNAQLAASRDLTNVALSNERDLAAHEALDAQLNYERAVEYAQISRVQARFAPLQSALGILSTAQDELDRNMDQQETIISNLLDRLEIEANGLNNS